MTVDFPNVGLTVLEVQLRCNSYRLWSAKVEYSWLGLTCADKAIAEWPKGIIQSELTHKDSKLFFRNSCGILPGTKTEYRSGTLTSPAPDISEIWTQFSQTTGFLIIFKVDISSAKFIYDQGMAERQKIERYLPLHFYCWQHWSEPCDSMQRHVAVEGIG